MERRDRKTKRGRNGPEADTIFMSREEINPTTKLKVEANAQGEKVQILREGERELVLK